MDNHRRDNSPHRVCRAFFVPPRHLPEAPRNNMRRAARVCPQPGCSEIIYGSARLCASHESARQKQIDSKRPPASRRGYDASWRRRRGQFLEDHPHCLICGKPANHVDHIVALAAGGADDESNWQPLCHAHHSQKTAQTDGGFGNRRGRGVEIAGAKNFRDRAGN